jgi:aminomethyltransferase
MRSLAELHESHGATVTERGGQSVVAQYGQPTRTHQAVRNGVGVIEHGVDVLVVTGADRVDYVDNVVSNRVPTTDGRGVYALLLTPRGRIRTDMYVFNAGERLLVLLPPGEGEPVGTEWAEKTFIQDVDIDLATESFAVLGVHGPQATEKLASVFTTTTPEQPLRFVRGSMGDVGVTAVRTDGLTGEEGYAVICDGADAGEVFDTLETRGLNAVPFGYQSWQTLTLEAGTPLFRSELDGAVPNNLGLAAAVDYEKGCFVGQEVVSRVANRGRPTKRLVGLRTDRVPAADAAVFDGPESVGTVTRAAESPTLGKPIALALVDREVGDSLGASGSLTVRVDGEERPATPVTLPFVEGSDRSGRLPVSDDNPAE